MDIKVGDYVECIKTPDNPTLIRKGEVYKVVDVNNRDWADGNVAIIDRQGVNGKEERRYFTYCNWFKKHPRPTNSERIKQRKKELENA